MHGHVPPDAARGGEDHVAAAALEHLLAGLVRGQVAVQAPAAEGHHYNRCNEFREISQYWEKVFK